VGILASDLVRRKALNDCDPRCHKEQQTVDFFEKENRAKDIPAIVHLYVAPRKKAAYRRLTRAVLRIGGQPYINVTVYIEITVLSSLSCNLLTSHPSP